MKVKPNKATTAQAIWIGNLRAMGYSAVVCYGDDDAMNVIKAYLAQEGAG